VKPWKVIAAALVIFLAGMASGAFAAHLYRAKTRHTAHTGPGGMPATPPLAQRYDFLRRLGERLNLSQAQREHIDGLIGESQNRMRDLWKPVESPAREELRRLRKAIEAELTPDQRRRYETLQKPRTNRVADPASGRRRDARADRPVDGPATNWPATALTPAAPAAPAARYTAKPGCVVTIDGTSTIHDWTTKGQIIGGFFELEPEFLTDKSLKSVKSLNTAGTAPKAEVKIPVKSLKSQTLVGASKMDEIMQEAMRMKENPDIKYVLKEMKIKGDVPASGSPVKFDTKGELAISGVTNTIDMEVTLQRLADDKIKFSATKQLKMTDYKITPPTPKIPGMSFIKTGDDVTVKFEWLLAGSESQASP